MNERDVELMRSLMDSIGDTVNGGVVLIDVSSTQFVRVNLVLLKGLLEELDHTGIFISVDRPHQYMVHLMRMHKICLDRITFIDVISRFSADRKAGEARVSFVDGPFHIDALPHAMEEWSMNGRSKINDMDELGFTMIDNIAALQMYNRNPAVELFINNFILMAKSQGNVLVPLVLDRERHRSLYDSAMRFCDKEVKVERDLSSATNGSRSEIRKEISSINYNKEAR